MSRQGEYERRQSQARREIGPIPKIANVRRRESCRLSLKRFCEVYNPEAFYFGWSADHLHCIQLIEESALHGALFAFAMPRGSGKTTICRMAALWAISYRHARYVFIVGANAEKARANLDAVKVFIRFLPLYVDDFPEIAQPAIAIGGIANRASGQTCGGQSTMIEWGKDKIVLPTVPAPPNGSRRWAKRADGLALTSGSLIGVSGLTGDGIRGSVHSQTSGEQVRPDFVLLDDPQTDESAGSAGQNVTREKLISGAVLGMAGPGKSIAAVMPCTVIRSGDMVDRILDRKKHPLWRGKRTKMLRSMPANLKAWQPYFQTYSACAQREPPDFAEANEYYTAHRRALDEGGEASWDDRKLEGEISAIQHAMNLYCRDEYAFFAEYQNEPKEAHVDDALVSADEICAKINGLALGTVPAYCTRATAYIDVQKDLLYWAVTAWSDEMSGSIVAYGAWPDQQRHYYTLSEAKPTLMQHYQRAGMEGAIYQGLVDLSGVLLGRDWECEAGGALRIERMLVDAAWGESTDVVKEFCRRSPHANVLHSFGVGVKAGNVPLNDGKKKPNESRGLNWQIRPPEQGRRFARYDTNFWKTFVHARLAAAKGDAGCLELNGADAKQHRMLADHLTAEHAIKTTGRNRELLEWFLPPHRPDNHLFDCVVGSAVAASMCGAVLPSQRGANSQPKGRRRYSMAERYKKRKGR